MSQSDDKHAALDNEMHAAERALINGQYEQARHHLSSAAAMGARPLELKRFRNAIAAEEQSYSKRSRLSGWGGFGIAAVGYIFLALQQPSGWTLPVWAMLAFVIVPGIAGYAVGKWQGRGQSPRARFLTSLLYVGAAMFCYTAISLIYVRWQIGSGAAGDQVFLVGLFVSCVYALIAGCAAGFVGAKLAWHGNK